MAERFSGDPFALHRQEAWLEHAMNPRFPLALRVAFIAFGRHRANGHARLRQGELAAALAAMRDGELIEPDRRAVRRAIQQAIEYGFLDPASKVLCLVVPAHNIAGGRGNTEAPCDRHRTRPSRHLRAVAES